MKVDAEQLQQNRDYLKKLIKGQRSEIAARETEIQNIKKMTEKSLDNERLQGQVKLMDIQDRNKMKIIEETSGNEDKLLELKRQVEDTRKRLSKEEALIKDTHKSHIQNINRNHSVKARDIFDRNMDEIQDLNFNVNEKVKDVRNKTSQSLSKIRHDTKLAVDKAAYENSLKVSLAQDGQANQLKRMEDRYNLAARQQEMEHKDSLAKQRLENVNEYETRQRIHQDRTKAVEKHYSELAKNEKLAFEDKYKNMIVEHKTVLDRLKTMFDKEFNNAVAANAKRHEATETRSQDSFYHLTSLEPQLREDEKYYYIDIKSPPHEKENYHLTAHDRKIKLSFNRRSEERLEQNGEVQTSNKSEAITREFKVAEIVDDKKLTESYKNGILSYRLPKA